MRRSWLSTAGHCPLPTETQAIFAGASGFADPLSDRIQRLDQERGILPAGLPMGLRAGWIARKKTLLRGISSGQDQFAVRFLRGAV